jgi:uncharacterized protein DUF3604
MTDTGSGLDRRHFLQTFLVSAAGATAMGALPIRTPAAWASWEPARVSLRLGADPTAGVELDESEEVAGGVALGDPSICRADDGTVWIAWAEMQGDHERIHLRSLNPATGVWGTPVTLNEEQGEMTFAYQPRIAISGNGLIAVWIEQRETTRRLVSRAIGSDLTLSDTSVISQATMLNRPAIVQCQTDLLVAWEEKVGDHVAIRAQRIGAQGDSAGEVRDLSQMPDSDCRRPAMAISPTTGRVSLAFDVREGAGHSICLMELPASGNLTRVTSEPHRITHHPASDIAPDLAFSPDGSRLWIGWHSNRGSADTWDVPRWYRLAAMDTETGEISEPATPPRDRDLEKREVDQGWEFVRLVPCADGGVWVVGRPSHNFCIQKYHGGSWSPIYRLPNDEWGGRGRLASVLLDDDGGLWIARRDMRAVALSRVGGAVSDDVLEPELVPFDDGPDRELANVETKPVFPSEVDQNTREAFHFYFGDIHGHTHASDGMGDVDEYFLRGRDLQRDDFMALTDHDSFVGQRLLNSQYEEQKREVEHYHDAGQFVTLYAQEWTTARTTSPTGYGHINFYSTTPDHPMMDHLDERWNTQAKVIAEAKRCGMIGGPHHVAWTGVRWDEFDPEVTQFVEMCSVHGAFEYSGNEPIPHRGGMAGNFVQDGLARGMKFAISGGSDQHGLIYHHRMSWKRNIYRAGLTGVLAPELTREAIFEAIAARRTFATTGVKLRMGFRINGSLMGSEIESDAPPQLHIDIVSPEMDIRWVEVVRSNETIYREGGVSLQTFFTYTDEDCPVGEEVWYYLRVVLDDNNMGWTSPIWVTRRA